MNVENSNSSNLNKKPVSPITILMLILGLGTFLRFFHLGTESYWIDEMSTVIEGQHSLQQLLTSGRLDQPPAFYLPYHFWELTFGTAEASTRSFAALIGVFTIVIIYLIGRELLGNEVGLISALLMAISEAQILYSQEARFYTFFEFSTLLSFLFFILAIQRGRKLFFSLYIFTSALMVYSHAFGMLILGAQNLYFLLQIKKYKNLIPAWLISEVVILLAIAPYLYLAFGNGGVGGTAVAYLGNLNPPSFLDPLRSIYRFVLTTRRDRDWSNILIYYVIGAGVIVAGTLIFSYRQGKSNWARNFRKLADDFQEIPDLTGKIFLLVSWLLIPILLPFIVSLVSAPIYQDRYTISAAPAIYLLLGLILFKVRKIIPLIISLGALSILIAPGLYHYYTADINENWRATAAYIERNSAPNELIIFALNEGIGIEQKTFDWYYRGSLPECGLNSHAHSTVEISTEMMRCISGHQRFWVIQRYTTESLDRYQSYYLHNKPSEMVLISEQTFTNIYVYLFEIK